MRILSVTLTSLAVSMPVVLLAEDQHDHGRMFDLSLNIMSAVGASTADNHVLEHLQAGGHDPNQRGFTFQSAELSISGAVDPYFRGESYLLFTPDEIELEEAFVQTTGLPYQLGVEAGYFLTEFGRNNPTHAHTSAWLDRPVVVTRLLGIDGMRGVGARAQWSLPTSWVSTVHVGAQNADDATMTSFRGEGHVHGDHEEEEGLETTLGGRQAVEFEGVENPSDLVWLLRWANAFDAGDWTFRAGASFLNGPNRTGDNGQTQIYGVDLAAKWYAPGAQKGAPYVAIEAEAIVRRAKLAAGAFDPDPDTPADEFDLGEATISDLGGYAQALYGWNPRWAAGIRVEMLRGRSDSVDEAGDPLAPADDPEREDRVRLSPVLVWSPSHFSRLRLQYNYDRFSHEEAETDGEDSAHSIWLGVEILIGAHPAHVF